MNVCEAFEVIFGNIQSYAGSDDDAGTHLDGRRRLTQLAYADEVIVVYGGTQAGHEAPELMLLTFADVEAGRVTQQPVLALTSEFVGSHVDAAAMGLQEVTNYLPQLRLAAPRHVPRHAKGGLARCVGLLQRVRQPVEEAGVLRRVAAAQHLQEFEDNRFASLGVHCGVLRSVWLLAAVDVHFLAAPKNGSLWRSCVFQYSITR